MPSKKKKAAEQDYAVRDRVKVRATLTIMTIKRSDEYVQRTRMALIHDRHRVGWRGGFRA